MTIDEAIRLLKYISTSLAVPLHVDEQRACKLGIEALEYAKTSRDPHGNPAYSLLPGETEK